MEEEGTADAFPHKPPVLPYSLRDRKLSITIFWTLFVTDTLAQPLVLYWALWYATDLSHNLGTRPLTIISFIDRVGGLTDLIVYSL